MSDSPSTSDSEEHDVGEEEYVDVKDMERRDRKHTRWRSELETGWW